MIYILLLLLLLPGAALADLRSETMVIDGQTRSYHVFVPGRLAENPPLVLVLHGGGGRGLQIMRGTRHRFNTLAERDGAVVVYPDAIDGIWDFGEGTVSNRLTQRRDDRKFFTMLIARLSARHDIDPNRIFATGISRGGQASFDLACKRPGLIRAIAPVAMTLPDFLEDDCSTMRAQPMLLIHGTEDPIVPYRGGPITLGRKDRGEVLSTAQTLRLFAARNRCSTGRDVTRRGAVEKIRLRGCSAPLWHYRVNGGGHSWPSGRHGPVIRRVVGPTNTDINATDEIWAFFAQFR